MKRMVGVCGLILALLLVQDAVARLRGSETDLVSRYEYRTEGNSVVISLPRR